MKSVMMMLHIATAGTALLAGLAFVVMIPQATGAPQQAAAGAMCAAMAVVPYVFTRMVGEIFGAPK